MHIAYYISSHGFGHAVRSIEIMRHMPKTVRLIVKTGVPEWFFVQELPRTFRYVEGSYDVGVVQTDEDRIDPEATLRACRKMFDLNEQRRDEEVQWLIDEGVELVVTDAPSFPLGAANDADVPGIVVSNFTWSDIYRGYVDECPEFAPVIRTIDDEYAQAIGAVVLPPNLAMDTVAPHYHGPFVARRGESRREKLAQALQLDAENRWWFVYPGNLGMAMDWENLEAFSNDVFITLQEPPRAVANLKVAPQGLVHPADLVAMVEGAIAKPGYSMVCECMVNGTPFLYTPRDHFVEYHALHKALQDWGGGICLPQAQFANCEWGDALDAMAAMEPKRMPGGGESVAAHLIEQVNVHNGSRGDLFVDG